MHSQTHSPIVRGQGVGCDLPLAGRAGDGGGGGGVVVRLSQVPAELVGVEEDQVAEVTAWGVDSTYFKKSPRNAQNK